MKNIIRFGTCAGLITAVLFSCTPQAPDGSESVAIDPTQTHQTIESFQASDCWVPNYVGQYWSETEKESIARLLFSTEIVDGQPSGIGLSGWRFNLGGGSALQGEQGVDSEIRSLARRADAFIDPVTGEWDWSRHAGQRYFLDKAKSYGVSDFVMFSNSPPVNYTINNRGFSDMGAFSNLKEDCYDDFARYMADVAKHFQENWGIAFRHISPVNEPQFNWQGHSQEGSGWQNSEIHRLTVELDKALQANGLDTRIMLSEAAEYKYLYEAEEGEEGRQNVLGNLWNPDSPNYVGNLAHVDKLIGAHSYWSDGNWQTMVDTRKRVKAETDKAGVRFYQTEWCMLGNGSRFAPDEFPGFETATAMDIALYMSKVIHCDLVYADAVSWSFWTSVDVLGRSLDRYLLVGLTPGGEENRDITMSGTHEGARTLWVLGNYSRFIRPGYRRIGMDVKNTSKEFFGSGYLSPDGKELVCVYTNLSDATQDVKAWIAGSKVRSIATYTTSETQDLAGAKIKDLRGAIPVAPGSVTTVVYTLK